MTATIRRESGFGVAAHGTYAGYNAHMAYATPPCDACVDARNRYLRWYRFRNGTQPIHRCRCGSVFPDHRCTL